MSETTTTVDAPASGTNTTETSASSQSSPTLNIKDIADLIACIDHACEHGAYKGWQIIEKVLHSRNRAASFVAAAKAQEDAAKGESADAGETTGTAATPVADTTGTIATPVAEAPADTNANPA